MEKAEARRLQPFFVRSFFLKAFQHLGGSIHPREAGRFEVTHVPTASASATAASPGATGATRPRAEALRARLLHPRGGEAPGAPRARRAELLHPAIR
jgi:hypothetical protein